MTSLFKKDNQFKTHAKSMSLEEYVSLCQSNRLAFAGPAERLLAAIGEPEVIDTSTDSRLSRIHSNRKIRVYKPFEKFYGIESTIEQVVAYLRGAAAGLEESRQILYLKGPVGSSKSSLVEELKLLSEKLPIYTLYDPAEKDPELAMSPVLDAPLSLFHSSEQLEELADLGIAQPLPRPPLSGWAQQKLREFDGDVTKFRVVEIYPSRITQAGVMKVEPSDENNQDVSVLVGKVDIRKLERYPQNHPYAYSYSGGLNRTNQGFLDFAEMFKANIKTLNPLLMATQEHNYNGTEAIPAMPYTGIICAHSNESEWFAFRNNKTNEAFLDRVFIVDVPYCLRVDEEVKIYEKMLKSSALSKSPTAPGTLKMLAEWMVATRLKDPENSSLFAKMKVYNGENVKDTMPSAKPLEEYKDSAGINEGMSGMSTRFAFKVLSRVFDLRPEEVQANPVDLMYVLEESIKKEALPEEDEKKLISYIKDWAHPRYFEFLEKELRTAYLESFDSFGQNMFDRYVLFAEAWIEDTQCRDPETHVTLNRDVLNQRLEEVEKPAGIHNPKDFRHEIVHYVLRYKAKHDGKSPKWSEYEKIRVVLEKKMFSATENIMPVVSFGAKQDKDTAEKHSQFLKRMMDNGYTENQVKTLVSWWSSHKKN